jgi:hypothetical protein
MKTASEREVRHGGLMLVGICLYGIYQVFNKESFIVLERWDHYLLLSLYFLGPGVGLIVAVRNTLDQNQQGSKLIWYAVFLACLVYIGVLTYGIYLEPK